MGRKKITVTNQTDSGRNTTFRDNYTGQDMTRKQFVSEIKSGTYDNFHVRVIGGIETPVSNPDSTKNNNLG